MREVNEIFTDISAHMIEGLMLHNDLADYFDFLGLMGFKRIHEYQYLSESAEMRGVHRYYINHFNKLLKTKEIEKTDYIQKSMYDYTRFDISISAKENAVKDCMEIWRDWERKSKSFYEECYYELCEMKEIAAACKVKKLVCDVDEELKRAVRLHIKLYGMKFDLTSMMILQDDIHEKYKKMTKEIGVDIC
jgi:hypothetical protein